MGYYKDRVTAWGNIWQEEDDPHYSRIDWSANVEKMPKKNQADSWETRIPFCWITTGPDPFDQDSEYELFNKACVWHEYELDEYYEKYGDRITRIWYL